MKEQLFILACLVSSMAFVSCNIGEKKATIHDQTGKSLVMEDMKRMDSAVSQMSVNPAKKAVEDAKAKKEAKAEAQANEVTPDLARNEINGGKVKRITQHFTSSLTAGEPETVLFDFAGKQNYLTKYKTQRDNRKRVTRVFESVKDNFTEVTYTYAGNSYRKVYTDEVGGYIDAEEGEVGDGYEFKHYYYADSTNNPTGIFATCCQDVTPFYTEYTYLEFDEYGNWTKRQAVTYDSDHSSAYTKQYEKLLRSLDQAAHDLQKNNVEPQLIALMKKSCKRPDKITETRKIEYYK